MTWDHRVIDHGNQQLIHEVYYERGKILAWSQDPAYPTAEESFAAHTQPTLTLSDMPK